MFMPWYIGLIILIVNTKVMVNFSHTFSMGVFETAYLLTTLTNYDVKLSKHNVVSEF